MVGLLWSLYMILDPKHMWIDGHVKGSENVPASRGNIVSKVGDRSNVPRLSTNQNSAFSLEVRYYHMNSSKPINNNATLTCSGSFPMAGGRCPVATFTLVIPYQTSRTWPHVNQLTSRAGRIHMAAVAWLVVSILPILTWTDTVLTSGSWDTWDGRWCGGARGCGMVSSCGCRC